MLNIGAGEASNLAARTSGTRATSGCPPSAALAIFTQVFGSPGPATTSTPSFRRPASTRSSPRSPTAPATSARAPPARCSENLAEHIDEADDEGRASSCARRTPSCADALSDLELRTVSRPRPTTGGSRRGARRRRAAAADPPASSARARSRRAARRSCADLPELADGDAPERRASPRPRRTWLRRRTPARRSAAGRRRQSTTAAPVPVTRVTSAIEVMPRRTFSRPSSRSRRMPWRTATSAISGAGARASASLRISSVTISTS